MAKAINGGDYTYEHALTGMGKHRVLFGTPTWFMGGNTFTGVFGDDVFLQLTPRTKWR